MDDSVPSSKKRVAETQLSRDKPVDEDYDSPEAESGTFKRASDEVLSTRKIIKVRRQPVSSVAATHSNPFSGIQFILPPSSPAETPPTEVPSEVTEKNPSPEASEAPEKSKPTSPVSLQNNSETPTSSSPGSATAFSSFQTVNAFKGVAGTGFPSSPAAETCRIEQKPVVQSFSVTEGETGEEEEITVFQAECRLYEYIKGGWKERGRGDVKVNRDKEDKRRRRVVMRSRGNYRLIMNCRIYPFIKIREMEKRGVTFSCVNGIGGGENGGENGSVGLSTFALKFKEGEDVAGFMAAVVVEKEEEEKEEEKE